MVHHGEDDAVRDLTRTQSYRKEKDGAAMQVAAPFLLICLGKRKVPFGERTIHPFSKKLIPHQKK